MKNITDLKTLGRIFYGICFMGIGVLHFFFPGFRPIILAVRLENPGNISILIYVFALYLIISGILIALGKKLPGTSMVLAGVLILFLVFGHLPRRVVVHPEHLGEWTNVFKLLSLIGGAFFVSVSHAKNISNNSVLKLRKLASVGKYLFCIMLLAFGIDHFIYVEFVSGLVPKWIPFPVFWAYFTGILLFGSGIAILGGIKTILVCQLLAIMLFIWLVTIHIPLAIRFPDWGGGENIAGSSECLAFAGIALLIAANSEKGLFKPEYERKQERHDNRP